jgi:hypothetical protein
MARRHLAEARRLIEAADPYSPPIGTGLRASGGVRE